MRCTSELVVSIYVTFRLSKSRGYFRLVFATDTRYNNIVFIQFSCTSNLTTAVVRG